MFRRFMIALVMFSLALLSGPGALTSLSLLHFSNAAKTKSQETAETAQNHDCCPKADRSFVSPSLPGIQPSAMPCGEQHPCCAKQVPQESPALPVALQGQRSDSSNSPVVMADHIRDPQNGTFTKAYGTAALPLYSTRSTVLRI